VTLLRCGVGGSRSPVSEPRGRCCSAGGVAGPNTSDVKDSGEWRGTEKMSRDT